MIELLVTIVVLALVFGVLYWLVDMIPIAQPFNKIVKVGLAVVFVLVIIGMLFGGVPVLRWSHA